VLSIFCHQPHSVWITGWLHEINHDGIGDDEDEAHRIAANIAKLPELNPSSLIWINQLLHKTRDRLLLRDNQ